MATTDATVTGLKMWDTNCPWVYHLQGYLTTEHAQTMNCCGTVRPNREVMTKSTGQKMKLKRGDTQTRVGSNLIAIVWQGKRK